MTGKVTYKKRLAESGEWDECAVYTIDGREVTREEYDAAFPDQACGTLDARPRYPHESVAMGVHPRQVGAATEYGRKVGIPTEYTPEGKAIITSRAHKREFLKHHGMHDNNAFGRV